MKMHQPVSSIIAAVVEQFASAWSPTVSSIQREIEVVQIIHYSYETPTATALTAEGQKLHFKAMGHYDSQSLFLLISTVPTPTLPAALVLVTADGSGILRADPNTKTITAELTPQGLLPALSDPNHHFMFEGTHSNCRIVPLSWDVDNCTRCSMGATSIGGAVPEDTAFPTHFTVKRVAGLTLQD